MKFKNYVDACQQIALWCQEEADTCDDPRERLLWLDGAAHWHQRALTAEREAQDRVSGAPPEG